MAKTYDAIYRARAVKYESSVITAYVPQVFGETAVQIVNYLGTPATGMGWVLFQGGNPEFPVWTSGLGGGGGEAIVGSGVTDGNKGDITVAGTSWQINPDVVTGTELADDSVGNIHLTNDSVDNTKLSNVVTNTFKGRVAAGTGDPQDLTPSQARTVIASDSGGGSVNFLRADGQWALPPGAGGGISGITVKEGVTVLGSAFTSLLFTAAGFDVTAAANEATVILDLTEYTGGALPLTGGGTGATSAAGALTALGAASAATLSAHTGATTSVHGIADTSILVTTTGTQTLTNKTIALGSNPGLTGTIAQFNAAITDADIATTAALASHEADTTAIHGIPDTTALVTLTGVQTLTSKTIDMGGNTVRGTTAQFNTALTDNDFATLAGTETLTNKSINLVGNTVTGTTALFNAALSDNDFATIAGSETLTGKTINLGNNTITGTASQFQVALSDSDFYLQGGTDVSVVDGGTGRSTNSIANGLIAAGALPTDPQTTIGPGTLGQFLKSQGAAVTGAFANIVQSDVTNLVTDLSTLTNNKADKAVAITVSSPLTGGGTLAASFSIGIPVSTTAVVGATRLSTVAEAVALSPIATVAVTPAALVAGYLQLTGGTVSGNLNITGNGVQLAFGSRSGQHILLASTTLGLGVQGVGGSGQDTVYFRAPTAFYWYQGGTHSDTSGTAGGGTSLLSLDSTNLKYRTYRVWHENNDGHTADSSGLNADMLDDKHATYFANQEEMEALLGDLLYVGTYDPASYLSAKNRYIPFNAATPNTITGWTFDPPTDASVEFRCDCTRPNIGVGTNQRPVNGALIFTLTPTSLISYVRLTDATYASVTTAYPNEVQTVTPSGTFSAGTFTLTLLGVTTGDIAWNATAATIKTALNTALPGNTITVAGGPAHTTAFTLTFPNAAYGDPDRVTINTANLIVSDALLPPVFTAVTTTPGWPAYNATTPARIQLRAAWDPTTDTITHYWRTAGFDLLDDVNATWTTLGSAVWAGKLLSEIAVAQSLGGQATFYYTGYLYRVWSATNSIPTFDFKGSDALPGQTVVTPTLASPGNLTLVGGGMARTQLYPDPEWSGGSTVYRHGMYWVCNSTGTVDFIADDASGRYPSGNPLVADEQITLNNGDWVVAAIPGYAVNNKALTANVATLTLTMPLITPPVSAHTLLPGAMIDVEGVDATFDGTYTITAVTALTVSYAKVNADIASTAVTSTKATVKGQTLGQVLFQYVPFSTETYVKNQILAHTSAADPHPQYLTQPEGDIFYAPVVHNHQAEIRQQVINHQIQDPWAVSGWSWNPNGVVTLTVSPNHSILPNSYINLKNVDPALNQKWKVLDTEAAPNLITITYGTTAPPGYTVPVTLPGAGGQVYNDPHSQYLDQAEADALYLTEERADTLYADIVHNHDDKYEPIGLVALHVAEADPHPQYLTPTEGDIAYAIRGHTHPEILELHPTDGANSADIWVGENQPTFANGLAVGDLWIQTAPLGLQAPTVKTLTISNAATGFAVDLSWQQWATSESISTISLERGTDGTTFPTVLTTTAALNVYTDTARTANTIYYYRLRANNAAGSGGYSPTVSIVTKPASVTGVTATSSGPTNSAVSWTAAAGGTGYTYEVYVNSVLVTTQAGVTYTATGITENETTTFGIRSKGSTGLFGTTVSDTITSDNAAPVQPTSITMSSVDYDSAVATWPASASPDRRDYEVFLGSTSKGFTTALSYTFTGLAASTNYTFGVRTRDTGLLYSPQRTTTATTAAPPDTTPPPVPVIASFQPEGSYGRMVVRYTTGGDTVAIRVDRSTDNANWTIVQNWTGAGPGSYALDIGTFSAGQTVYCRVYVYDPAVNVSYTNASPYTLITSPTYVTAHSTNHYRANGTWNAMGTSRPIQGYYSNSAYNATGCWFYNNKPTTALYYGGRRTILSGKVWMKRMDGGDGVDRDITMYLHRHTVTTADGSAPQLSGGSNIDANLAWNGAAKSIDMPAGWANYVVDGSTWKGVAIFKPTSDATTNYMTLANLSEDANTGRLEIHHLG